MLVTDSASAGAVVGEYTLQFDDTRGAGGTLQSVVAVTGGAYDPVAGRTYTRPRAGCGLRRSLWRPR